MKSIVKDERGILNGMIYLMVTVVMALVIMLSLGPVVNIIMVDWYGELTEEDTPLAGNSFTAFSKMIDAGVTFWEFSFIIFVGIAGVYLFARVLRRQGYSQYER